MLVITKQNSVTLNALVTSDGVKLTQAQLDAATSIEFMVKVNKTDADVDAVISKSVGSGITTLPDGAAIDPNLEIVLTRTDTDIAAATYFVGLQVIFSPTTGQEAVLKIDSLQFQQLQITQDVIRS